MSRLSGNFESHHLCGFLFHFAHWCVANILVVSFVLRTFVFLEGVVLTFSFGWPFLFVVLAALLASWDVPLHLLLHIRGKGHVGLHKIQGLFLLVGECFIFSAFVSSAGTLSAHLVNFALGSVVLTLSMFVMGALTIAQAKPYIPMLPGVCQECGYFVDADLLEAPEVRVCPECGEPLTTRDSI
ncbi:MAG: hypothetical protein KDD64_16075 [Bdellovibrionales bacterium]|nr:hypothetical protein [Bdellovibrionales bacterium]